MSLLALTRAAESCRWLPVRDRGQPHGIHHGASFPDVYSQLREDLSVILPLSCISKSLISPSCLATEFSGLGNLVLD